MPTFNVIIEWRDDFVRDADEMQVIARSPTTAIKAARKKWAAKFGDRYPHCRITSSFVLTDKEMSAI